MQYILNKIYFGLFPPGPATRKFEWHARDNLNLDSPFSLSPSISFRCVLRSNQKRIPSLSCLAIRKTKLVFRHAFFAFRWDGIFAANVKISSAIFESANRTCFFLFPFGSPQSPKTAKNNRGYVQKCFLASACCLPYRAEYPREYCWPCNKITMNS